MGSVVEGVWPSARGAANASFGFVALVALVVMCGCGDSGPAKYPVCGVITYQGKPVPTGNVMLVPVEGGDAALSIIRPDGTYSLETIPGKHRVGVTAVSEPPPGTSEMNYRAPPPLVPAKYGRPDSSGLVVDVQPVESNPIDIRLQ